MDGFFVVSNSFGHPLLTHPPTHSNAFVERIVKSVRKNGPPLRLGTFLRLGNAICVHVMSTYCMQLSYATSIKNYKNSKFPSFSGGLFQWLLTQVWLSSQLFCQRQHAFLLPYISLHQWQWLKKIKLETPMPGHNPTPMTSLSLYLYAYGAFIPKLSTSTFNRHCCLKGCRWKNNKNENVKILKWYNSRGLFNFMFPYTVKKHCHEPYNLMLS